MKSTPLIINWHDQNAPVYSAHFEQSGKGRLATAGGDNNVRIWKVEGNGEDRKVEYLSTLSKHTQAVNVVRWSPKGDMLASAGDDGNVILWVPAEHHAGPAFGNEGLEDKETWRTKHMCRSSGSEIYDLAWSPDGTYFIIGSMDNITRIYNASSGVLIRQIAEHSHYVQGVTWDPLNEFVATQSSDRSVHVYSLKTKDGQYTLSGSHDDKPSKIASHNKSELPPRRISSSSPAPPEFGFRSTYLAVDGTAGSPVPSAPGTPTSIALPMNPPSVISHSRRSSFSSSARRSPSPAPSMPLPAVMPMEPSPKPHASANPSHGTKNASLYANETLTSFFRRLTFTPDGSLLLTPAGQYQSQHVADAKSTYEVTNTVYIYSRGGINKAPVAHLPGHKKPSVVVKCSPIFYTMRTAPVVTKNITIDTSSAEEPIPALPEPVSKQSPGSSVMDPPPPPGSSSEQQASSATQVRPSTESPVAAPGPKAAFALPYRMIYAVGTQDSVLLYDTQQQTPICVVSNLHLATFTDLAWSSDGLTLLITSSDGFCSTLSFSPGELGQVYQGEVPTAKNPVLGATPSSNQNTPVPTPTSVFAPPSPFPNNGLPQQQRTPAGAMTAPSPPSHAGFANPPPQSPARSNSTSSVATQSSAAQPGVTTNPSLIVGSMPSITATNSGKITGVPLTTPPETPSTAATQPSGVKREASDGDKDGSQPKKRRIAPTLVEEKKP
ncbi:putative WD repeat-containing protein C26H5.03 like [Verticillium longisporum]|uniref:CAF1B/HIR1 beta-propeller domain-containing protein n=3 Tax=Verticillium TaxID=1036719 RepID=A0A444S9S9_VERDA|nr:uncharacterized protein D7B24_005709 [Verticillium nonalfalfae]KAG7132379.1 putative WD repeat-containing protein C26H5.03 like [Verticillium longisporum]RNJ57627.1 hypothetical protein D7B24_005709 [Verticillium nonalfalfae]RXG50164.1 hypothetical protein VDGE_01025 [Verticillium dahliae]